MQASVRPPAATRSIRPFLAGQEVDPDRRMLAAIARLALS
jgi:hypothetical protein